MPKSKSHYPEIKDIQEDLDSLRTNVVELTKHVKEDGVAQSKELKGLAKNRWSMLKNSSRARYQDVENHIKDKPGQSVAIAFAAGLVASALIGRR